MLNLPAGFDSNVLKLVLSFISRADHGLRKYGVTTDRKDLSLRDWCQHFLEEMMDGCVYMTRVIKDIDDAEASKALPR